MDITSDTIDQPAPLRRPRRALKRLLIAIAGLAALVASGALYEAIASLSDSAAAKKAAEEAAAKTAAEAAAKPRPPAPIDLGL
jgi:hypothetical protein